jgi:hypothetical protein
VGTYPVTAADGTLAVANYRFTFVDGTLTVVQGTPQVTWPEPAPIEYGTALGASQLNAAADVAGAFTYTPPTGTLLGLGTHTLTAVFQPDDTANWTTVTAGPKAIEVVDTTAPRLTSLVPLQDAVRVPRDAVLVLTFTEAVFAGTGTIRIMSAGGDLFENLALDRRGAVTIAGTTVSLTHEPFPAGGTYHVLIDATCLRDAAGNAFAGIADAAAWAFTVRPWEITFAAGEHGTLAGEAATVTLTANQGEPPPAAPPVIPATGWSFVGWAPPLPATVSADILTTAQYEPTLWTLAYTADAHGSIAGSALQAVPHGEPGTAVTAVPDFGYLFDRWSDGRTDNPRTDTSAVAPIAVTASFRLAGGVAPDGLFLAHLDAAGVRAGHGLWDLTGAYPASIMGKRLTMNIIHDSGGRLSGTATLQLPRAEGTEPLAMTIKGSVRGTGNALLAALTLQNTHPAGPVRASLAIHLVLDVVAKQLVGPVTGSLRTAVATTPVAATVALALPPAMDGTWTLQFALATSGRDTLGTARLTLANEADCLLRVTGRGRGTAAVLNLAGDPEDPSANAIRIRTTIATLEGRQARMEAMSYRGYGQDLHW